MNAAPPSQLRRRRYRRRILGWGAVALLATFGAGAAITGNQVEDDLERRVARRLTDAGVGPVTVQFRGQDGTLRCDDGPVAIPDVVLTDSRDEWGVRRLRVDDSCAADEPQPAAAPDDTVPDVTVPPTIDVAADVTIVDVLAGDSQFSELRGLVGDAGLDGTLAGAGPLTLFAPTNAAIQALGPDEIAAFGRDPDVLRDLLLHHVADGSLLAADLVDATDGIEMLDGTTITVDPTDGVILASANSAAAVTEADVIVANGVVHAIDHVLLPEGIPVDDPPTTTVDTDPATEPGTATADDAAVLEAELNEVVAANPVRFEPGSTEISDGSAAVLDRIADLATRIGGVSIEVRGHTDTDGTADVNDALSLGRATAVVDALVARGVASDVLTAVGFGGTLPIVDAAGVEDKQASRRVEFAVAILS